MSLDTLRAKTERQFAKTESCDLAAAGRAEVSWRHRLAAFVAVLAYLSMVIQPLANADSARFASIDQLITDGVGLTALLLAVWVVRSSSAGYIQTLAFVSAFLAVAKVAIATLSAQRPTSVVIMSGRSLIAECSFGLTVCVALFTRFDWRWDEIKSPDVSGPSFRQLSVFTGAMAFIDSFLGAAYRTQVIRLAPHLILGVATAVGALWMLELVLNKFSQLRELKIGTIIVAELIVLQLFIGLMAYSMELSSGNVVRPLAGLPVMRATHTAVGALTVAMSLFATLESFKYLAPRERRI